MSPSFSSKFSKVIICSSKLKPYKTSDQSSFWKLPFENFVCFFFLHYTFGFFAPACDFRKLELNCLCLYNKNPTNMYK